jgi:hypothetical protein
MSKQRYSSFPVNTGAHGAGVACWMLGITIPGARPPPSGSFEHGSRDVRGSLAADRHGRPGTWDRDSIIEAIQEWVALHGEPPRAADWNPSSAKWSGQLWRVERYRAGGRTGLRGPALNAAKRPFGGSLSAAIRAAGFEPARPGPHRRRDVEPEQAARAVVSPEAGP